jgi:glycine cleavage system H protein
MSVILALLFVGIAIGIGTWLERKHAKIPQKETLKAKLTPIMQGIFVHPGHAWVEAVKPNLVTVGTDEFTKSVFGSVKRFTLPEPGTIIQQGGKAWGLRRGKRELVQTAPISGRVMEINKDLVHNPKFLLQKDTRVSWILKIKPIRLKRELQNLLRGNMLARWNQAIKEQLVATLTLAEFPVLQEGGEIKPNLGDELTPQQWAKVAQEFF